jgi:hypothetical protein
MSLILDTGFEIVNCYYAKYENIAVELVYKGQPILLFDRELGNDLIEVEIYNQHVPEYVGINLQFPLEDFLNAIEKSEEIIKSF